MSPEEMPEERPEGHLGCGGATIAPRRIQPAIGPLEVVRLACAPSAGSTRLCVWWGAKGTRRGRSEGVRRR